MGSSTSATTPPRSRRSASARREAELETRDLKLDGNAIAGELFELFGVEMTVATGVCAGCGAVEQVARLDVYVRAPGTVVRCPHCDAVLMRIVRGRDRVWLDLSGVRTLEMRVE